MSTDTSGPFKIELTPLARAQIQRCAQEAKDRGMGHELATALREIVENLSTTPTSWGDPQVHFRHAKLRLYQRIWKRILVIYAVHEEQPVVFVKECKPVLGHPLESAG